MKLTKRAKKIMLITLTMLLAVVLGAGYFFYQQYIHPIETYKEERLQKFINYENSFNEKPNISDAFRLIDWYFNDKKDNEKAIYFGNECIRLGVEKTPAGFLVNYQLSVIHKANNNYMLSKEHLLKALKLDKNNRIIKNEWIKEDGLCDILSPEEMAGLSDDSNE